MSLLTRTTNLLTEKNITPDNESTYRKKYNTRGNGARALHALFGNIVHDEYIWVDEEIEISQEEAIQNSAKKRFLELVQTILHQEHPLKNLLIQSMEERLLETDEFKSKIFLLDEEMSRLEQDIRLVLVNFYWQHQSQLHPIFETCPTEFDKLKSDLEAYRDISLNLMNCFNANFNELKSISFEDPRWTQILSIKEYRFKLEEQRAIKIRDFLINHFDLYSEITQKSSCYLTIDELQLAAETLLPTDIRVLVFFDLH